MTGGRKKGRRQTQVLLYLKNDARKANLNAQKKIY